MNNVMTRPSSIRVAGLVAALLVAGCGRQDDHGRGRAGDEAAIKQVLVDWYAAYSGTDEARYTAFLTEDYRLLENGVVMGREDDVASMRNRPSGYRRTDAFDFRSVTLHGDIAFTVYFLESEMSDDTKVQHRKWLESAVLRHADGRWRVALLHSTKVLGSDEPRR